jgi:EmrB/QacA subfamily drug resistance transporter
METAVNHWSDSRRVQMIIALLVAGTLFMENLDATAITPAMPHMAASFGVLAVDLHIGVSAYMLTLGIFLPVSGWIANRFGTRRVFVAAIALFTIASLLCGLAQTLDQFVAMRIVQGIAGALMVPVGRLVVLRVTPKEHLIQAIAVLTWPGLVAFVLGPPIGGLIADYLGWRWIFYLNLPLGLVALVLASKLFPQEKDDTATPFDWAGFLLTAGALFCLLWVTEVLGRSHIAWMEVLLYAVIGSVLMIAGVWHLRRAAHPVIRLDALSIPTFGVAIWGGSLFRMGISAVPFLIPLMFQLGFGMSATQAGMMLMSVFCGNLMIKPATTPILRRFGFRPVLLVNGVLNVIAIAACALFTAEMPIAVMLVILFIGGMTRSMQFTAVNTIAFADVDKKAMSDANAVFSIAFQLAVGLGVALGAIGIRIGERMNEALGGGADMPFRIAFVLVAMIALLGLIDSWKLAPDAGKHLSQPRKVS